MTIDIVAQYGNFAEILAAIDGNPELSDQLDDLLYLNEGVREVSVGHNAYQQPVLIVRFNPDIITTPQVSEHAHDTFSDIAEHLGKPKPKRAKPIDVKAVVAPDTDIDAEDRVDKRVLVDMLGRNTLLYILCVIATLTAVALVTSDYATHYSGQYPQGHP